MLRNTTLLVLLLMLGGPLATVHAQGTTDFLARFFVSSNTESDIGVYTVYSGNVIAFETLMSAAADADGIYYDDDQDVLYQLNREDNVINAYSNVYASILAGINPPLTATSTSDFTNGREISANEDGTKLVVAQDAAPSNGNQNALIVYDISPNSITLDVIHRVAFNLWGIQVVGDRLYAVVDNTNMIAIYKRFFELEFCVTTITPNILVSIDGLVRTHGLFYDRDLDLMILTDVGDAADDEDGAIVVIRNFLAYSIDDNINPGEQIRIEGNGTFLGNPVDVAYDAIGQQIYVAERANGGGRVLCFDVPTGTGSVATGSGFTTFRPNYNNLFPGASAIYLDNNLNEEAEALRRANVATPSSSISTKSVTENTVAVAAYPNPTHDQIRVSYDVKSVEIESATVEVLALDGSVQWRQKVNVGQGLNTLDVNVSELRSGSYVLRITHCEGAETIRFVKQ